jgi:phosphate uptake regulator
VETRKLQKTGGSTYIVSLPKQWVVSSSLKEGDPVSITVDDNGLLILDPSLGARRQAQKAEVVVEEDENDVHLMRRLIGLYISGHDEIIVMGKGRIPPETRKTVRDFSRKVIGSEIVEESGNVISIQDVADHSNLDMRKILRRMHLMSRSMHTDALDALLKGDTELAGDVVARDDEVDRLYWFMAKQRSMILRDPTVARKMGVGVQDSSFYLAASKALERIADHASRIAYSVSSIRGEKMPEKIVKEMQTYGSKIISVLDSSVESILRNDLKMANQVADEQEKLRESGERIIHEIMEQRSKAVVPLALVVESLERTGMYSADIAETAINLSGTSDH